MTTTVKITSHNFPALIRTTDRYKSAEGIPVETVTSVVITPDVGELTLYCTTTRTIEVVDLEYDDPRVLERQS